MVEVPALLWQLPALLRKIDFLSVGTNDLLQFLFASDRGNPRLADRYDMLSPAMLKILAGIVDAAERPGSRPPSAARWRASRSRRWRWLRLGFRSLSMAPPAIGPVRAMARSLDLGAATAFIRQLFDAPEPSLRSRLQSYARDHEVVV